MLNKKSLSLAVQIAKQFPVSMESAGNLFSPAILYSAPVTKKKSVSLEEFAGDVSDTAGIVNETEGVSLHEQAINEDVEIMVRGLCNQFDYVRKTVRPFISKVSDKLVERLRSSRPSEFSIREFNIPDFLFSETAKSLFKEQPLVTYYKVPADGTVKEVATIVQEISTNIPDIDKAMGAAMANLGESALVDVYNVIICNKRPTDGTKVADAISRLMTKKEKDNTIGLFTMDEIDVLLLAYFVADGYLDNPVPGTGLSLQEYRTYLAQVMVNVGSSIARLSKAYERAVARNILIMSTPKSTGVFFNPDDGIVRVNAVVYRKALAAGISAETIIGAAISPDHLTTLDEIAKAPLACKRMFEANDRMRQSHMRTSLMERVDDALKVVLNEALVDMTDDQFPANFKRTDALANISGCTHALKKYFNKYDSSEEIQIYDMLVEILSEAVFPFVDAKEILDLMEQIINEEDCEPAQAGYYAFLRYMARWAVANFKVTK